MTLVFYSRLQPLPGYTFGGMHIHAGNGGVRYPCVLLQMGTLFRETTKAKQDGG